MSEPGADADDGSGGAVSRIADASDVLESVREDPQTRWIATATGAAIGLLAASLSPLGLVLGGALVSIPARDVPRGIGASLGFGLLVVAVFLLQLLLAGAIGPAVALGLPFWLAVGIALVASLLGGLARGVV